jgi:hypothetical protein
VIDLAIPRWIRGLGENGAVELARQLIFAEAGKRALPLADFTMSGRVKVGDQGIDGRTNFPSDVGSLWPSGHCVWQIKSGGTSPSPAAEFDREKHKALIDAIQDGCDYVLFWTNDPVDPRGKSVRENFTRVARAVRSDVMVHFLFCDAIERMCTSHLGVLGRLSPIPIGAVVSLDVWARNQFDTVAFQPDDARLSHLETLRNHARSTGSTPTELYVLGDTGVGKSRLVYEALAVEGIQERVLVAQDALSLDRALLSGVANSDDQSLILVVDDCEAESRKRLSDAAGLSMGRVRLIMIGSRTSREASPGDQRFLELFPLQAEASKQIALSMGLSDSDSSLIARYTEGYPGLARDLANAMRYASRQASVIERVRGHETLGPVLSTLLPAADVVPLGMLALFERLGFDGELAQELSIACKVLGFEEARVREVAGREMGRFVSSAGRYRRVTPRLFAIWLASRFIDEQRQKLRDALTELPQGLRDRILNQMREFGDDRRVAEALELLLDADPFRIGAIADVGEGAARLLHVGAVVTPKATMSAINRVLDGTTVADLTEYGAGRRDMVCALQLLLWFEDTFNDAATALLRLALAENESWSNNATGTLKGIFGIFLGGTAVPFGQRLEWASRAEAEFGAAALPLLIPALGCALTTHESRMSPDFGGRNAPDEWQPRDLEEEMSARRGAWAVLMEVGMGHPELRDSVAEVLSSGIRTMVERGAIDVVRRDIPIAAWPAKARGSLAESIAHCLAYDNPSTEIAEALRDLRQGLQGRDLHEQLEFVFAQSPWQLTEKRDELIEGRPKVLLDVVDRLLACSDPDLRDVAVLSIGADGQTVATLFEVLGERLESDGSLADLGSLSPTPEAAILGLFAGLAKTRDAEWAERILNQWLDGDLKKLVIRAAHRLQASETLVDLAIASVDRGEASSGLALFLYGAWARPLEAEPLRRLLSILAATADGHALEHALEHALGILEQWLEVHGGTVPDELRDVASDLLDKSNTLPDKDSSMLALYRGRILEATPLDIPSRLQALKSRLRALSTLPRPGDLEELDRLLAGDSAETVHSIVGALVDAINAESREPWLLWIESARLLSHLGQVAGYTPVIEAVDLLAPQDMQHELLPHIDFSGEQPDPLFVHLLEAGQASGFEHRAHYRFAYPEMSYWGGDSHRIRQRMDSANQWLSEVPAESKVSEWLHETLVQLTAELPEAIAREEEREP